MTLTREQIEKMEAGPEMDALVGIYVMQMIEPLPFSSDISAAWQVVEKMEVPDGNWSYPSFRVVKYPKGRWWAGYWTSYPSDMGCDPGCDTLKGCHADSAPVAICRAALLATLVKNP